MKLYHFSKHALWVEFLLIFGGLPLLIMTLQHRGLMIGLLWLGALLVWLLLRTRYERTHAGEWNWPGFHAGLKPVLLRFLLLGPAIGLLTWIFLPEHFMSFPRERFDMWWKVMLLYPLLSVWPQEIIFRSFLYYRYEPLWGNRHGYVLASAAAFGFAHILLMNPVAVIMTALGGYLFARDYAQHKSLALACLEHALYGCWAFTLGLGIFFYTGAAWK